MAKKALVPRDNLQHNVPALLEDARGSLWGLAHIYLTAAVAGQAPATIQAKRRDLARFITFYEALYGHDRPEEWYSSVTREFLRTVARQRLSGATLARTYATVRHFARWAHNNVGPFPLGCPTDGVKPPPEPEPEWKGLSRADELRLLNAAQTLRVRPGRGTNQGLRDHAAIAVLLGSGLRVSELLGISVDQYSGRGFRKVLTKGSRVRDFVPVQRGARKVLKEWLKARGGGAGPIFTTRTGAALTRTQLYRVLQRVTGQANASLPPNQHLEASPHVLRHNADSRIMPTQRPRCGLLQAAVSSESA